MSDIDLHQNSCLASRLKPADMPGYITSGFFAAHLSQETAILGFRAWQPPQALLGSTKCPSAMGRADWAGYPFMTMAAPAFYKLRRCVLDARACSWGCSMS